MKDYHKAISDFYVAGINYRKTDASIRGRFAVGREKYSLLLSRADSFQLTELLILSTCNRTEIYGFSPNPLHLINFLCSETEGPKDLFQKHCYIKKGMDAIEHLFIVGAGIDSQILGDYEIVGQLKNAAKFAKEHGFIEAFMERLLNCVLRSSKSIKNQTALSGGTVSVSFSAVQYIRQHVKDMESKKILLLGVGKIGRNTCKNLTQYLTNPNITVINRTDSKAEELAKELGLNFAPFKDFHQHVNKSEIILVATDSPIPLILKSQLEHQGKKLVIDLSIPNNVETSSRDLSHVTLVNVDELSRIKDETLQKRSMEIPKARAIISHSLEEFMEWYEMRKHVPVLKAAKNTLKEIHDRRLSTLVDPGDHENNSSISIQRVINGMATKLRHHNKRGCHYIEAINEFIDTIN